ncbi:16S rRNA (adenine(1518)-N(6)/adenine(1519)-N(6))-dimethyltransferase RsmA [uncultured Cocleimonas sp.]|uniref:16S rRNA (adenine(1518)-N(6)/adenine(1519)-N(6))- dimethyltransferase RsmA n=1 Tax=uncultured Cocleimonas sp. TaxID=1051587 RepID=UPI00261CA8EB|nr:16S rRNA (adenine(1518)-N(6)/adenine(1519)-N(6))-dimethyltransferase RsmA [uncultured Cocleimonas sp.]
MQDYKTKKRFGQHFLNDHSVIEKLIYEINPKPNEKIVEIGPGLGALTFPLLDKIDSLNVVEIDRDVIARLQQKNNPKLNIHGVDALKFDFRTLLQDESSDTKLRVVGNLPYNISTPLIFHLLEYRHQISDMHFMLQNEVVNRITAEPGSKTFGRLSVMVQYFCNCEYLFFVGPESFSPPPKVDSAILKLTPWSELPFLANDEDHLSRLVAQAFSMRRKTLRNNLKKILTAEQIETAGIDPSLRAESLSVKDFVTLSNLSSSLESNLDSNTEHDIKT